MHSLPQNPREDWLGWKQEACVYWRTEGLLSQEVGEWLLGGQSHKCQLQFSLPLYTVWYNLLANWRRLGVGKTWVWILALLLPLAYWAQLDHLAFLSPVCSYVQKAKHVSLGELWRLNRLRDINIYHKTSYISSYKFIATEVFVVVVVV